MTEKNEEINPTVMNPVEKVFGRADFDKLPSPKPVKKYIESLKGFVYFRQISGKDLEEYEHLITKLTNEEDGSVTVEPMKESLRAKWLVVCLCDEQGTRLYKPEEFSLIERLDAGAIKEMYDAAQEANNVAKEALERARKNLSTGKMAD